MSLQLQTNTLLFSRTSLMARRRLGWERVCIYVLWPLDDVIESSTHEDTSVGSLVVSESSVHVNILSTANVGLGIV